MNRLVDWFLDLFCEPEAEPEPAPLPRMLACLANWRHDRYRLRIECSPHFGYVRVIVESPSGYQSEGYLIGNYSDREIAERLDGLVAHIQSREAKAKPANMGRLFDLSTVGRDN